MFKLSFGGETRSAQVIVLVGTPEGALKAASQYFNTDKPFLGIVAHEGSLLGIEELSPQDQANRQILSELALVGTVDLVGYQEDNPGTDPATYDYRAFRD